MHSNTLIKFKNQLLLKSKGKDEDRKRIGGADRRI